MLFIALQNSQTLMSKHIQLLVTPIYRSLTFADHIFSYLFILHSQNIFLKAQKYFYKLQRLVYTGTCTCKFCFHISYKDNKEWVSTNFDTAMTNPIRFQKLSLEKNNVFYFFSWDAILFSLFVYWIIRSTSFYPMCIRSHSFYPMCYSLWVMIKV